MGFLDVLVPSARVSRGMAAPPVAGTLADQAPTRETLNRTWIINGIQAANSEAELSPWEEISPLFSFLLLSLDVTCWKGH